MFLITKSPELFKDLSTILSLTHNLYQKLTTIDRLYNINNIVGSSLQHKTLFLTIYNF